MGFFYKLKHIMEKKTVISTLAVGDIRSGRISGNSIRQVDFAIDQLYKGNIVKVEDHRDYGNNRAANRYLYNMIVKRLEAEHNLRFLFATDKVRLNKNNLEIEFL